MRKTLLLIAALAVQQAAFAAPRATSLYTDLERIDRRKESAVAMGCFV